VLKYNNNNKLIIIFFTGDLEACLDRGW